MIGSDNSASGNGVHGDLIEAIRALRRLRREELRLLRRIERALGKASQEVRAGAQGVAGDSPTELPEWLSYEVDTVLSGAFDDGRSSTQDPAAEASSPDSDLPEAIPSQDDPRPYLLLGSSDEWVCLPWPEVEGVELRDPSAGVDSGHSLRSILGQAEAAGVPEPFCISLSAGPGRITCQSVGGIVTLDEAARRGVECVLVPEVSDSDGGVRISMKPLLEAVAFESSDPLAECQPADATEDPVPAVASPDPEAPHPPPITVVPHGLVAIRYLPARVGITRALRSRGWLLRETADLAEVPSRLQKFRYQAAFIEIVDGEDPGLIPALQTAAADGCRIVAVGSRLRGRSGNPLKQLGEIPRLLYPFHESEVEKILDGLPRDQAQ